MPNKDFKVPENTYVVELAEKMGCHKFVEKWMSVKSTKDTPPWSFRIYKIKNLSKKWKCEYLEDKLLNSDLTIHSSSLYAIYNCKDNLYNKDITIHLKNGKYSIHPGHQRYLLNCILDDFNIDALLIDYDINDQKVIEDFGNAILAEENSFEHTLYKSSDTYNLKFNFGWPNKLAIDEFALEAIHFYESAIPNSEHSVNILLDNRKLISYDNEKPEMNVHVDDIYGWAKFIIDYYCERKLTYNGYTTNVRTRQSSL